MKHRKLFSRQEPFYGTFVKLNDRMDQIIFILYFQIISFCVIEIGREDIAFLLKSEVLCNKKLYV